MNVLGTDVSFYQDDPATARQINFGAMRAAGADFVFIRAGQNQWVDPDFSYNWARAKVAGSPPHLSDIRPMYNRDGCQKG